MSGASGAVDFGAGGVTGIGERTGVEVGLGDRMRAGTHHRRARRQRRDRDRRHTREPGQRGRVRHGHVVQRHVAGIRRGQGVRDDLADRGRSSPGSGRRSWSTPTPRSGRLGWCPARRARSTSVLVAWPVSANVPASRSAWVIAWVPVQTTDALGANVATGIAGTHENPVSAGVSDTDTLCKVDVAGVRRGQRVGHDLTDRVVGRRVQVVGLGQRQHRGLGGLDGVRGVGRGRLRRWWRGRYRRTCRHRGRPG